jgi:hypothetical protein
MALIDLRMSLNVEAGAAAPEVRAFIDLQPERGLGSEIELPLRRRGKREWVGTFAVGESQPRYFLYRVALAAHVGASWELLIRERGSRTPLLTDADTFTLAKCWLVGSCDAPSEQKRISAEQALGSATGATACRLLLASTLGPSHNLAFERLKASQHREPQHDRTRNPSEQKRLFVLGELTDQRVRTVDERPRKPQRDDGGV